MILPEFLSRINNKEVSSLLRKYYLNDQVISKEYRFDDLLSSTYKIIQGCRYEQTMLRLSRALDGYDIYLPAYLDFRGRIYCSEILHFHERDLTRSLLLFSYVKTTDSNEKKQKAFEALAFHYKSFETLDECREWYNKTIRTITDKVIDNRDEEVTKKNLIELSAKAKHPFQFMSHALGLFMNKWGNLPIVQDASVSTYQLMSYFLLNEKIAIRTNLIPNRDGKINDIYTMLLEELLGFFDMVLSEPLLSIIKKLFNRSLVKSIYMPIIYRKSLYSVCTNLKGEFSNKLTDKECREITKICFRFWSDRYHGMDCLIKLIRSIGWVVSSRDSPVCYKVPFFRTIQDYMEMKPINVWIYDVNKKKRRRVTLRVTTDKRDRRKSEISTFMNFIHQKDAYIAVSVIETMLIINAPVYTVDDNFISTATYCDLLPLIYSNVIRKMGPPLLIINELIYMNIIKPVLRCEGCEGIDFASYNEDYFRKNIIDKNLLKHFLERNIPTHIKKNKNAYNTWLDKNKKRTRMMYAFSKTKRMLNSYTTSTESYLLNSRIEKTTSQNPHPRLIIASHHFIEGGILIRETDQLSCSTMVLLIKFAYPSISGYAKFTISFTMRKRNKEKNKERISFTLGKESISFTLGPAIPLTYEDGNLIPTNKVNANIVNLITQYKEIYKGEYIENITIRVYFEEINKNPHIPSEEEVESILASIFFGLSDIEPIKGKKIKKSYPSHITAIKSCRKNLKCFLVGDIETIVIDNVHKPYVAGLMMVHPNEVINQNVLIETFFSEDDKITIDSFDDRSTKVLNDLIVRTLSIVRRKRSALTIYFHNFSRFDGIFLLKSIACHHKYELRPLLRNNRLYELGVYSGKKMLFRFRDSLNLLLGSLNSLASSLCPELGTKGSIDHENVTLSNLGSNKKTLLDYMKQDILLLGGIMRKAQDIYWKLFQINIESKITLSLLALTIFRMNTYNEKNRPIHILNKNEDNFLRRAYYGGHTNIYIPYGENLYYYDVNSLYPFVMKEFPMPGGVLVWHRNLEDKDLNSLFGFIEAYVVCPKTIKRLFLPYRDKNKTLIFPIGEFIGVYYSEFDITQSALKQKDRSKNISFQEMLK
ncbi:LOW QUALITY PROTEIN: hypothetical protein Cgig2_000481 [Carnegiea gigantea]|uniref:DNA-directed DNA polymerase n=1 Tax=Carnegiea gigantea TaxID=171969 RepID=A0A9Q1K3D9_9CARY|nr:LOW QUALITY PROTEIN: hypothetical protein Cgig2_001535 [Carnegiea gigantea]KAJ8436496.1 LOW QUALITY PROTEIN: hypothetical protein Cgig2_000481 [Carnegiea gigantea]